MKEVRPLSGQTLIDIAIQELGDAERLFDLAVLNNKSVTDAIDEAILAVPEYDLSRRKLVLLFAQPSLKPASDTGLIAQSGFWNFPQVQAMPRNVVTGKDVRIYAGQTLIDIAIQELGDPERLFDLAVLNGKGITDTIEGAIVAPDYTSDKRELVILFSNPMNKPASERTQAAAEDLPEGISFWGINIDFIVS